MLLRDVLSPEIRIKSVLEVEAVLRWCLCTYRVDELQCVSHSFEDEE